MQLQDFEIIINTRRLLQGIFLVIQQSNLQLSLQLSDIYNAQTKYQLAKLAGRIFIQVFLKDLI